MQFYCYTIYRQIENGYDKNKDNDVLKKEDVVELGNVIVNKELQRTSDEQITIVDLTGVAVQDIQISKAVYQALFS